VPTITFPDISPFIANDRSAIRYYLAFSSIIVCAGIGIFCIAYFPAFKAANDLHDIAQKAGGIFVSCLGAVSLKECLARRDRLRSLLAVRKLTDQLQLRAEVSDEEVKRATDLIWEIYKKGTTG